MPTAYDVFLEAALVLAGQGSVKDRLAEAWCRYLRHVDAAQLPESHRADFRALSAAMQREPALPREDPVRASVRKMSLDEASRHAALVMRIYGAVARGNVTGLVAPRPPATPLLQLVAAESSRA